MGEINFLTNKDDGSRKKRDKKGTEEEIKWSEPITDKTTEDEKRSFGRLSFFKRKSKSAADKKELSKDGRIDKVKLKHSRKEVLKLIKEHESGQTNGKKPVKIKTKKGFNLLSWWNKPRVFFQSIKFTPKESSISKKFRSQLTGYLKKLRDKFKKSKDHKEILVDYQRVFKDEKKKRVLGKDKKHLFASTSPKLQRDELTEEQSRASETEKQIGETVKKEETPKEIDKKERQEEQEKFESIEWENPDILETNLIKGEIISFFDWRKNLVILLSVVISVCLTVGAIYGGLIFWQKSKEKDIEIFNKKFTKLNSQIQSAEKDVEEVLTFQKKLKLVSALLDKHIYWTNFFKLLEDNTIADVYYLDFSGGIKGNYNIAAMAESFNAIYQQIKTMQKSDNIIEVKVKGGDLSKPDRENPSGGVNFNLELSIDPKIFTQ